MINKEPVETPLQELFCRHLEKTAVASRKAVFTFKARPQKNLCEHNRGGNANLQAYLRTSKITGGSILATFAIEADSSYSAPFRASAWVVKILARVAPPYETDFHLIEGSRVTHGIGLNVISGTSATALARKESETCTCFGEALAFYLDVAKASV